MRKVSDVFSLGRIIGHVDDTFLYLYLRTFISWRLALAQRFGAWWAATRTMSFRRRHPAQVHLPSSLLTAPSPTHTGNFWVSMEPLRPPSLKSSVWITRLSSRLEIGHLSASIRELTIHSFDIRNTSLQTATSPSLCVIVYHHRHT